MGNSHPQTHEPVMFGETAAPSNAGSVNLHMDGVGSDKSVASAPSALASPLHTPPGIASAVAHKATASASAAAGAGAAGGGSAAAAAPISPERPAPVVFHWKGSGRVVQVALSDDHFRRKITLTRSGSGTDFIGYTELPPGLHHYRFFVDGVWKAAAEQPVDIYSGDGALANVLNLDPSALAAQDAMLSSPPGSYNTLLPNPVDTIKNPEPPALPPQMHMALLNSPPTTDDTSTLPVPQHVVINHLYSTVKADNVLLFGVTHRYREKFVTTVFYTQLGRKIAAPPPQQPQQLASAPAATGALPSPPRTQA